MGPEWYPNALTSQVKPSSFAGTDKKACIVTGDVQEVRPMLRATAPNFLGDTVDDTLACISDNCPLDESTLSPSPSCVLGNCTSHLAKCLFSSSCRHGVMCELKCTEPLAKTEDAVHFAGLMESGRFSATCLLFFLQLIFLSFHWAKRWTFSAPPTQILIPTFRPWMCFSSPQAPTNNPQTTKECMRVHCPGFPPSKSCAALYCGVEAAECAVHSKCRETLECADACVPGKYTAALAALPHATVV